MAYAGLEDQLQQAKQHAEQFKSMSEANETALADLNTVRQSQVTENLPIIVVMESRITDGQSAARKEIGISNGYPDLLFFHRFF